MQHTVEKISSNKVKIVITVPAEEVSKAAEKAYFKMRGSVAVPGFRKGKAPRSVIERMYGPSIFYQEAAEDLFPEVYSEAVMQSNITPVDRPEINVDEIEKDKDLVYNCEVFVVPEVTLGEYKGVAVNQEKAIVAETEVDETLAKEQKRVARMESITDRALAMGDEAELDYSGSVDGVLFDGGTAENQKLVIGSASFIPGFEEQMVGMQIGEEKDLTVTFPTPYHSEELQGKDAVFHVKLNGINHEEMPALDDEFAQEVSDFDTLADYKADITANLQKKADELSRAKAENSLLQTVVNNVTIDVPNAMIEDKTDEMIAQMEQRMQAQGFTLDMFLQFSRKTREEYRNEHKAEALISIKNDLTLLEIAKAENIEVSDAEVDEVLNEYTVPMNKSLEELKDSLNEGQLANFKEQITLKKTMEFLWDNAVVTEVEPAVAETAE